MILHHNPARPSALPIFEALPGIADVVWGTVLRLEESRAPTNVLFTAPERGAGTSVLACATAIGLAQHQRVPVCLIETNVARPALARYLALGGPGLSDILDGRAELEDCLQHPRGCPGLLVLPAGTQRAPAAGEFTTPRMTSLLAQLEKRCHYLVVDSAPLLDHVGSRLLLQHADGVLLVLRARATRRSDAERAHDILVESGTPVLGSIFNDYRSRAHLGGNGRAHRWVERIDRHPPARLPPAVRPEIAANGAAHPSNGNPPSTNGNPPASNGSPPPSNGVHLIELPTPAPAATEAEHRHQVDILEQRIAKLTGLLEQTEADLRRIAGMKNIDLGIASVYRGAQGLQAEDEAQACKRALMQDIFEANLELKTAMALRH